MRIYIERRSASNEVALLERLRKTCRVLGHRLTGIPHYADLSIVWGWLKTDRRQPTLHCEQGWLPRWLYQISHQGLNAESHVRLASLPRAARLERRRAGNYLRRLRALKPAQRVFAYASPNGDESVCLPDEFVVLALQVEGDRNLAGGRSPYCSMMDLVLDVALAEPPWPIVIRPHPAKVARRQEARALRRQDSVVREGTVHMLLRHQGCRGLITCNSNTAHDAMIWDRPVIALGRGVWPDQMFVSSLPQDLESWQGWAGSSNRSERLDYVVHLRREQWSVGDAGDPERVRTALEAACR